MDLNKNEDTSFQFKPITKGLGFNKKNNFEEVAPKKSKPAISDSRRAMARSIQKNLQEDIRTKSALPSRPAPLGVSTPPATPASTRTASIAKDQQAVESALSLFHKFFSWSVDTALILLTAMASTLAIDYFVTNAFSLSSLTQFDNWIYITGPLFSFYFVFYYSIFWKTTQRTLGMVIFNLEIQSKESQLINLKQTFLRSLIAFVSLFTFGILDILGLTDALSWTSVTKAS